MASRRGQAYAVNGYSEDDYQPGYHMPHAVHNEFPGDPHFRAGGGAMKLIPLSA